MNGVHDMGGMHGFGSVDTDATRSFHADWERRVLGIDKLLQYQSVYGLDEKRAEIERIAPARYLSSGYYERWLLAIARLLEKEGLLAEDELERHVGDDIDGSIPDDDADTEADATVVGDAESGFDLVDPGADLLDLAREGFESPSSYDRPGGDPAFDVGDAVTVRNIHPEHHTRCPRYVRRASGEIASVRGMHVFPDANARGIERAEPLYSVRFETTELWGTDNRSDAVYVDLWEPYLEPIEE